MRMNDISLNPLFGRAPQNWSKEIELDLPLWGKSQGLENSIENLERFGASLGVKWDQVKWGQSASSSDLIAAEFSIPISHKQYPKLFIAVAMTKRGDEIQSIRIYHSLWPLKESHQVRPALFSMEQRADVSPLVYDYHQALTEGKTEGFQSLFRDGGSIREPSGDSYIKGGSPAIRDFADAAFSDGGIQIQYHTFVEEAGICAAEYTCYKWGTQNIPPQAGMEFWEIDQHQITRLR